MAEFEAKVDMPVKALAKLIGRPWLERLEYGPVKRDRLISVHCDTPKLRLSRSGDPIAAIGKPESRNYYLRRTFPGLARLNRAMKSARLPGKRRDWKSAAAVAPNGPA